MAIYTGVADANGDFTVPFSYSYIGGQKVTVAAEKNGAQKSIELYAPSEVKGGGVIQFSGTLENFPRNIGVISIIGLSGVLNNHAFSAHNSSDFQIFRSATGLMLNSGITEINDYCFSGWENALELTLPATLEKIKQYAFRGWTKCKALSLPDSVSSIGSYAFNYWNQCTSLILPNSLTVIGARAFDSFPLITVFTIPGTVLTIESYGFSGFSGCNQIIVEATIPPAITSTSFYNLKTACVFKVPAGSVEAYKAAPNWSAFAARIQAI